VKRPAEERSSGSLAISIALHVLLGALLVWVLSIPAPFTQWLHPLTGERPPQEHVSFVVPRGAIVATGKAPARAPVGIRPQEFVAPTEIPSKVPEPPKPGAAPAEAPFQGPIIGGAGPGISPEMHDPRIWLPPGAVILNPRPDNAAILDTNVMRASLNHLRDSLLLQQKKALSTVFEAGGKKYGVDDKDIYIADIKIPSALLSVLPIHPTGYQTVDEAVLSRQTSEINYQAGRALDAEDFKTAIKRIRERKEREHQERLAAEGKGPPPPPEQPKKDPKKAPRQDPVALQSP